MDMPKDDFVTRRFAEVVRARAVEVGYDVDAPRGGGKTSLAADTGMSLASVSRMLSGQVIPEARFLAPLASALRMDVVQLFVLAGLLPDATNTDTHEVPRPITAAEAARELGITDPTKIAMFRAMVGTLLEGDSSVDRGKKK